MIIRRRLAGAARAVARLGPAAADLALGSACAGCGEHPGLLCPGCRVALLGPATRVLTVPGRPDLPLAGAATYAGPVRAVILEHKEHGRLPLAVPLGDALAVAVTALLAAPGGCGHPAHGDRPVLLVPVPSARPAVRRRGHDPVLRSARRAAGTLRRSGQRGVVAAALRHRRRVADQAGLGRRQRERNLSGSLACRRSAARLTDGGCVVIVDDIVTTGATLRESARALAEAGVRPCGAVVVAVV
jgi:predicted amidophosphoribosyltransferase